MASTSRGQNTQDNVIRMPLPSEAKERLERAEEQDRRANGLVYELDTPNTLSAFILDCLLWVFVSAVLTQILWLVSRRIDWGYLLLGASPIILVLAIMTSFLHQRFSSLRGVIMYRILLVSLGVILGGS